MGSYTLIKPKIKALSRNFPGPKNIFQRRHVKYEQEKSLNARSGERWEDFFHIGRMLEADLKLPLLPCRKGTAYIFFCSLNHSNKVQVILD